MCVRVFGWVKCDLHCGGLEEHVNTGCQPLLHDGAGEKQARIGGSVDGNRGR